MVISANKQQNQPQSSTEFVIQSVTEVVDALTFEKFSELFKDELLQLEQYHNKWLALKNLMNIDIEDFFNEKDCPYRISQLFGTINLRFGLTLNNVDIKKLNQNPMFFTDIDVNLRKKLSYSGINGNVLKYLFGLISYHDVCVKLHKNLLSKVKNTLKKSMTGKADISKILNGKLDSRFFTVEQVVESLLKSPIRILNVSGEKSLSDVLPNYLDVLIASLPKIDKQEYPHILKEYLLIIFTNYSKLSEFQQNYLLDNGYLLEYLVAYGSDSNHPIPEFNPDVVSSQALNILREFSTDSDDELFTHIYPYLDYNATQFHRLSRGVSGLRKSTRDIDKYIHFLTPEDRKNVFLKREYFNSNTNLRNSSINFYGDKNCVADEFLIFYDANSMLPDVTTSIKKDFNLNYLNALSNYDNDSEAHAVDAIMVSRWFDLISLSDFNIKNIDMYIVFHVNDDFVNLGDIKTRGQLAAKSNINRLRHLLNFYWNDFMPNTELNVKELDNFLDKINIKIKPIRTKVPLRSNNTKIVFDTIKILDCK